MNPDCCTTTTEATSSERGIVDGEWARIEAQAQEELRAAQLRFDAVRALRRVYDTHGHSDSLMQAAADVVEQYPVLAP